MEREGWWNVIRAGEFANWVDASGGRGEAGIHGTYGEPALPWFSRDSVRCDQDIRGEEKLIVPAGVRPPVINSIYVFL